MLGKININQWTYREEVKRLTALSDWRRDWGDHYIRSLSQETSAVHSTQGPSPYKPISISSEEGPPAGNEEDPRRSIAVPPVSTRHSALWKIPDILNLIFGESYQGIQDVISS